jgi:hypothetical protein
LPAVLVECGFLTNPVEAQLALTPEYREQVAEQIAAGIIEQRQFSFPPLVPNHQGRLVHKTKKHRKVVDSALKANGRDQYVMEGYATRARWAPSQYRWTLSPVR